MINDRSFSFHRWSFDEYSLDSGTSLTPLLSPPPSSPLSYLLASLVNYYVPSSSIHHRVFETVYFERRPNLFTPVIFTPNCNFATIVQLLNRYLGLLSFALSAITFDHIESTTLLLSYHFNYTYFNKFLIKNLYRI